AGEFAGATSACGLACGVCRDPHLSGPPGAVAAGSRQSRSSIGGGSLCHADGRAALEARPVGGDGGRHAGGATAGSQETTPAEGAIMSIWIVIVTLSAITYGLRASFLLGARHPLPTAWLRMLRFVPPAVLAALVIPALVGSGNLL